MRFCLRILLITGIAATITGCQTISGFFSGSDNPDAASTDDSADVTTTPPSTSTPGATDSTESPSTAADGEASDGSADEAEFPAPTVEELALRGSMPDELIPSTSAEERVQEVLRDRPDPFDILATTPTIEIPQEVRDALENSEDLDNDQDEPDPGFPLEDIDDDDPAPELEPIAPPPPPQPETARAVAVSGVVQIGSVPYAIVNAPNEPHSRYVRSGQLLSNGQVLVKRIELFPGVADPIVVLEEFGIEVPRQVGEEPLRATPDNDQPQDDQFEV